MRYHEPRRHPSHFSAPIGPVFLTWRLHRSQPPLRPDERDIILSILARVDGELSATQAAVVMDDHVHALVQLGPTQSTSRIVHTWKGVSAHRLTKEFGRLAPIWQRDYFDRSLRSPDSIERCVKYIAENPVRRWPETEAYRWLILPG